jgi:hypothetical protein
VLSDRDILLVLVISTLGSAILATAALWIILMHVMQ